MNDNVLSHFHFIMTYNYTLVWMIIIILYLTLMNLFNYKKITSHHNVSKKKKKKLSNNQQD